MARQRHAYSQIVSRCEACRTSNPGTRASRVPRTLSEGQVFGGQVGSIGEEAAGKSPEQTEQVDHASNSEAASHSMEGGVSLPMSPSYPGFARQNRLVFKALCGKELRSERGPGTFMAARGPDFSGVGVIFLV
jgi:hypothetical protein